MDAGEDIIALIVVVISLAALFAYVNSFISSHAERGAASNSYRLAYVLADRQAAEWGYVDPAGGRHSRVLDAGKICEGCPSLAGYNLSFQVEDLRIGEKLCSCGVPSPGAVARLPVALRYGVTDIRPGMLEVCVGR